MGEDFSGPIVSRVETRDGDKHTYIYSLNILDLLKQWIQFELYGGSLWVTQN